MRALVVTATIFVVASCGGPSGPAPGTPGALQIELDDGGLGVVVIGDTTRARLTSAGSPVTASSWHSDDGAIATVDSTGLIRGLGRGTTTIRGTAGDRTGSRPEAFGRYVCGSPSLAAGDYEVFRLEERYAAEHKDMSAAVFFAAGEAEVLQGGIWGLVSSMARMAELLKLRAYPSLALSARIIPAETHVSVIPPVVSWGLRSVWVKDSAKAAGPRE